MKLRPWGKAIAFCAVVFVALAATKALQIRSAIAFAESFPEHSETVKSTYTKMVDYRQMVSVIGEVKSPKTVALYTEIAGRIVKVGFQSGEPVSKGQVLIQQDISEEAALLDAARARQELAQTNYERNASLFTSGAVSKEAFDSSRVDLATLKAEIVRLEAVIRKKTIKAPFAGKAGIHDFEEGMFVKDNVLVTQLVGARDDAWVDFSVPQFYPVLEKGDRVDVRDLMQSSDEQQPAWVSAEVIARSPQVNPDSRSYQYRAKVPMARFNAGVNAGIDVRLPVSRAKSVIAVPVTAVNQDHFRQYVYLLAPDEKSGNAKPGSYRAVQQAVKVIAKEGGLAFIAEGLEPNQLIAADGAFKLYPGLLVYSNVGMEIGGEQVPAAVNEPANADTNDAGDGAK